MIIQIMSFYKAIKQISFDCNLEKSKLQSIMNSILTRYCQMKVSGYNKKEDHFWSKKLNTKCECNIFVIIAVQSLDYHSSQVIVTPVLGKENEIDAFVTHFKEALQEYKEIPFVKHLLEVR